MAEYGKWNNIQVTSGGEFMAAAVSSLLSKQPGWRRLTLNPAAEAIMRTTRHLNRIEMSATISWRKR
jgi:hypothetical protein